MIGAASQDDGAVPMLHGVSLTPEELREAAELLKESPLFTHLDEKHYAGLSKCLRKSNVPKGEFLLIQGQRQDRMYLLHKGSIRRLRENKGKVQHVDISPTVMGSLHLMRQDHAYASLLCITDTEVFTLTHGALKDYMRRNPDIDEQIIYSLSRKLRVTYRNIRTPLLQQEARASTLTSTAIAAASESFYRSALNALLNSRLTGSTEPWTLGRLFPSMHVQLPSRVLYITGLKNIRTQLQERFPHKDITVMSNPLALNVALAISPGLIMTPVSSILEACNAHLNTEPLWRRWSRGLTFRAGREVSPKPRVIRRMCIQILPNNHAPTHGFFVVYCSRRLYLA